MVSEVLIHDWLAHCLRVHARVALYRVKLLTPQMREEGARVLLSPWRVRLQEG